MSAEHIVLPQLSGYQVLQEIGSGGFSEVFRVRQLATGQLAALKVLKQVPATRAAAQEQRFEREIALLAQLHHPHIVQLLDKGQLADGRYFAVFELVDGISLSDYLLERGALPANEAGELMLQVLDALVCAHRQGIVHRDLKPHNIMVVRTGAACNIKVLDFGIGAITHEQRVAGYVSLTLTQDAIGTPQYCAPEQIRGDAPSTQSDLYAWGLVFLECLLGQPALNGSSIAEILHFHLGGQEVALPPALIGHPLADLLRRVLKKKIHERSRDTEKVWQELKAMPLQDLVGVFRSATLDASTQSQMTPLAQSYFREKRQLTVLSCQLSIVPRVDRPGAPSVDLEALEILQRDMLSQCMDLATQYGGWVADTFVEHFLVYFGYPQASDTAARRAACTAQALLEFAEQKKAQFDQFQQVDVQLRVGMHTGQVLIAANQLPTGFAMRVATQLAQMSPVNSALLSSASVQCLGPHHALQMSSLSAQTQQLYAWDVFLLTRANAQTFATTSEVIQRAGASESPIYGRGEQLLELREICATGGQIVWLRGEAGIGKSRLLQELLRQIRTDGINVWSAHCQQEQQNRALSPILAWWHNALHEIAKASGCSVQAALQQELAAMQEDLSEILPICCVWLYLPMQEITPSSLPAPQQKKLFIAVLLRWVLHKIGNQACLLVLEDLHWADPTTQEWLESLVPALAGTQISLLLSARPECTWRPALALHEIALPPLTNAAVLGLAANMLGTLDIAVELADLLLDRCAGIPLFAMEMLRMMRDEHLLVRDGKWHLRQGLQSQDLPLTLRDLLCARLDRLGAAREMAQLAAVLGREFDAQLLHRASAGQFLDFQNQLEVLTSSGILLEQNQGEECRYLFCHALMQDAAYETMSSSSLQMLHAHVARVLEFGFAERVAANPFELARHLAAARDYVPAVAYGLRAARAALERSLNKEALQSAQQSLQWNRQRADGAESWRDELQLNNVIMPALMVVQGFGGLAIEDYAQRSLLLDRQLLAQESATSCAQTHQGMDYRIEWAIIQYQHMRSKRGEARALAQHLVEVARGQPELLAESLPLWGLCLATDGEPAPAVLAYQEAIACYQPELAQQAILRNGIDPLVHALTNLAMAQVVMGQRSEAMQALERASAWAQQLQHLPSMAICHVYQAQVGFLAGHLPATLEAAQQVFYNAHPELAFLRQYSQAIFDWQRGEIGQQQDFSDFRLQSGQHYLHSLYEGVLIDTLLQQQQLDAAGQRLQALRVWCESSEEQAFLVWLQALDLKWQLAIGTPAAKLQARLQQACQLGQAQGSHLFVEYAQAVFGATAM